ncbi:MAG: DNA polymerase III subunit alpha, partial [Polyangiaceae bacterium]|nr:DNA polymerase III subunit alpha [Polyangiaceae bacterium]
MKADFVHLHVHSQYSFLTSSVKVDQLAPRCQELGMQAVALTDSHNMFGAIRHYKTCRSLDMQPILGAELNIARAPNGGIDHLTLLAANLEGYQNLVKLVSAGHAYSQSHDTPSILLEKIAENSKGLIGLSGCLRGVAPQKFLEEGQEQGEALLGQLKDIFEPGNLYVELNDHGFVEQPVLNQLLRESATRLGLSTVATNTVHFMNEGDATAQLYLECIRRGRSFDEAQPTHHGSNQMYLKSPEEMQRTFADDPESIKRTLEVAEKCSDLELVLGKPMLPNFPVPEGHDTGSYFQEVSEKGLESRFEEFKKAGFEFDETTYRERLKRELGVITSMEFPGYFLIVWDFILEAKKRGIPVGPGRGSGAGALVAYSLGITDLDPLPYNLLFERFLNPERVSMPDFDIDFCMSRRDKVIDYVSETYGRTSVGQIATFQNLKARSVIKDVARVMNISAQDAQRIASMIPEKGPGQTYTIGEALEIEPKLKDLVQNDPQIAELIAQSQKLEGLTRHAGMHAAGVVISEGPLDDYVPIFKSDESLVTQYD